MNRKVATLPAARFGINSSRSILRGMILRYGCETQSDSPARRYSVTTTNRRKDTTLRIPKSFEKSMKQNRILLTNTHTRHAPCSSLSSSCLPFLKLFSTTTTTTAKNNSNNTPSELQIVKEELRGYGSIGSKDCSVTIAYGDPKVNWDESIAIITICNPNSKNAMSGKMMAEFSDIIEELLEKQQQQQQNNKDSLLRCIVLRGANHWFCSGADIKVAKQNLLTREGGYKMNLVMSNTLHALKYKINAITLADIEGGAIGGGAEIAVACDFRFFNTTHCEEETNPSYIQFVQNKMGIVPGWGGGQNLIDIVGKTTALELFVTCQKIDSTNRHSSKLIHPGSTLEFMNHLQRVEPHVLQGTKRMIRGTVATTKEEEEEKENRFELERNLFLSLWGGPTNLKAIEKSQSKKK